MPGETFEFTFTEAGLYPYHGEPHRWMQASVEIVENVRLSFYYFCIGYVAYHFFMLLYYRHAEFNVRVFTYRNVVCGGGKVDGISASNL